MSRHRNVRRLVKEQQFYDDDEEDDDYDDKDYEHEEYYNSDAQQDEQYNDEDEEEELDVKVASLLSMLPKDTRCSREQAQNALLKNHMDVEKAMRSLKPSLLPPKHPAKSEAENPTKQPPRSLSQMAAASALSNTSFLSSLGSLASLTALTPTSPSTVLAVPTPAKPVIRSLTQLASSGGVELERGLSGLSALSATAQIPVKQQKSAPQTSSQTATKGVGLADILPKQTRSGNEPQKSTEAAAAAVVNDRLCISPFPALASQKQEAKARELLQPSLFAQTLFAVGISQDCAGDPNEEYSKSAAVRLNQGPFHFSSPGGTAKAPFKFDTPSPDDLVMKARQSSSIAQPQPPEPSSRQASPTVAVVTKALQSVTLEQTSAITTAVTIKSTPLRIPLDRIEQEWLKRQGERPNLNLVVIGHVDAGKSTLMGHLLHLLGEIDRRTVDRYERDSQQVGKGSFHFAWVLDATAEERERGVTIDVATAQFRTEHRQFTLLDAPGHRDFIPNMIAGAAQADAAVLVVDASSGAFESGFQPGGQTKEHTLLARSLGVTQLVVAINKMDAVQWSQLRFDQIQQQLLPYLTKEVGFHRDRVSFIPCSGLSGGNLTVKLQDAPTKWYTGLTLCQQLDRLDVPTRLIKGPLCFYVTDVFKGGTQAVSASGSVTLVGRLDQGSLQTGQTVLFLPLKETALVRTIQVNDCTVDWAAAGDSALVTLTGIDPDHVSVGGVLCNTDSLGAAGNSSATAVSRGFECQLVVFDIQMPILQGSTVIVHHRSVDVQAVVKRLKCLLDKSSGSPTKQKPRVLTKNCMALVEIELATGERPLCVDSFKQVKDMGRITVRRGGETIAAGIITQPLLSTE